jgi:hypothetical protein
MSEEPVPYGYKPSSTTSHIVINHDSWAIKLYRKKRSLSIETLDYHSGPLVLTRDDLVEIARKMGLHVRTRKNKKSPQ